MAERPAKVAKPGDEAQAEGKELGEAPAVEAEASQSTVTASESAMELMLVEEYPPLPGQKSGRPVPPLDWQIRLKLPIFETVKYKIVV